MTVFPSAISTFLQKADLATWLVSVPDELHEIPTIGLKPCIEAQLHFYDPSLHQE
jgi:hypothetical protein